MKLLTYSVSNFRGISSLSISPNGSNVNIYGRNGTGKTTAEDGFLWLLLGKDSADKKDYDLIPHKAGLTDPDVGCGKEPTVEATLEYFGKTVKLKKSYIEEWPKKGELKGQYSGSKTHFYVDDLEVKAGGYQQAVSKLVDEKLFKLITNPKYFTDVLSWQECRATLVKIAGELGVDPGKELLTMMCGREFDKFYMLSKQYAKAKQKELEGLPYAITEARRLISTDMPPIPDVPALSAQKLDLENQISALKNDDYANTLRRDISLVETEISEARNKYTAIVDAENARFKAGIEKLENERQTKTDACREIHSKIMSLENEIECLSGIKANKLKDWHEANDRVWIGSDSCPTCGQVLPAEQVESTKAAFNRQRSEDLERLKSYGTALKVSIEEKQASVEDMEMSNATFESEASALSARIEKGRSIIKVYSFETTPEYETLKTKLDKLRSALTSGTDYEKQHSIKTLESKLSETQSIIDTAARISTLYEQKAAQEKRVAELMEQEKNLNSELGTWEKAVNLCEQHVKAKAKSLETAVNGLFKIARFRLFAMQKNGEEAECCDVVYPNGSTNLSTGERLQVGIDIINTLTEYYGVDAPIWIDNAEGITLDIESKAQLINLIVSKDDEKLRVEVI